MTIGNGIYCIWLDSHIGILGEYEKFKERFQRDLEPINSLPPDSINNLILCFEREIAPIKFVPTADDALVLIQNETDKRIILISSGSLGKEIIPFVLENYPRVYSIYVFCGDIANNCEWTTPYMYFFKMFDHETDLLLRLVRDISNEFIKLGRCYLTVYDGESARKCFVAAETLETHANDAAPQDYPQMSRLMILQGPNGLIKQSQNLKDGQQTNETLAFVDNIRYALVNLSTVTNPTADSILNCLEIYLPPNTLIKIHNASMDELINTISRPACLFVRNDDLSQQLIQCTNSTNLSIYRLEDSTKLVDNKTSFNTIDDLINKLVELVVMKYRQQAEKHSDLRQTELANIENRMADRIEYEVSKLREE